MLLRELSKSGSVPNEKTLQFVQCLRQLDGFFGRNLSHYLF